MEIRDALGSTVKDVDDTKRQVLWEFPHDVVDTYKTTFSPTAFEDSFRAEKPVICWQHLAVEPLGRAIEAQVLRARGVNEVRGQFSEFGPVPLAHRAYSQIKDGSLPGVSFGFERLSDERHPEQRGVTRITKARMKEVSPVTFPSIPGAVATDVRQEVPEVEIQTIRDLVVHGVVSPEQAQIMLRAAGVEIPEARADTQPITAGEVKPGMVLMRPPDNTPTKVRSVNMPAPEVVEVHYEGEQQVATFEPKTSLQLYCPANPLVPGPKGMSATTASQYAMGNGRSAQPTEHRDDDGDAGELAAAVDAALDEADRVLDGIDTRNLPPEVQQALNLSSAASAAVDDLLEVMGVPDADEAGTEDTGTDAMAGRSEDVLSGLSPELREQVEAELRRNIPQKERDKIPNEDCAGKGDSFPINKPEDVSAAASSMGRAGPDNLPPDQIKANIIRIAKKKGPAFVAQLPDAWKADDAKREARERAALKAMERRAG